MPRGISKNGINRGWIKKGEKLSEKTRMKMAFSRKGKPRSEETKLKISQSHKGIKHTDETKKKFSILFKGRKHTKETRKKISNARKGENCNFWKGGITEKNKIIRTSLEYKLWRESVFKRDKWTCLWCFSKKNIQADHIKPFADYPELRFAIDNGRTLCRDCHRKTDTWGFNYWINKTKK